MSVPLYGEWNGYRRLPSPRATNLVVVIHGWSLTDFKVKVNSLIVLIMDIQKILKKRCGRGKNHWDAVSSKSKNGIS